MVKATRLKYTHQRKDGSWWFRRGRTWRKLPGDPGTDKAANASYWEHLMGVSRRRSDRTVKTLIASYKQSPAFLALRPVTRGDYDRVLTYIETASGNVAVERLRRADVIEARNINASRPSHANRVIKLLSILCEHAIDLDWISVNPAKGVKHLPTGEGHQPWPSWAIAAYRAAATGPERTAFELCLGTGQRIGDVLRMRWDDIEDGGIHVRQSKTGAALWIPFTPNLAAYLDTLPTGLRTTIIATRTGEPYSYRALLKRFERARTKTDATDYTFHGLRYNAASELFEAGCTDAQVQAITGHKSREMVARYGRGARQRKLAKQARERKAE